MALYSIESESFLGMSHCGTVTVNGESAVELSDEEVDIIVDLIRKNNSTDIECLNLEALYPEIYEKLREAYYQMAYDAEELHWLWERYNSGYFEYDTDELMEYCRNSCGFSFEYYEDEYIDDDGKVDEDRISEDEYDAFSDWLDDYVNGLSDDEVKDFFYNHMNAGLELDDIDYTVEIPAAIISKAQEDN